MKWGFILVTGGSHHRDPWTADVDRSHCGIRHQKHARAIILRDSEIKTSNDGDIYM
jgi:hypothetical protein